MRALVLLASLLSTLPLAFIAPHIGVLIWSWLSFMSPQQLIYLPTPLPIVYVVALVTAGAWLFSSQPKRLPSNLTTWLIILFMADMTISASVSITPEAVWPLWDRNIKTMVLALAIMALINNRVRIQAMIWTMVLSIGFYSVKGGIFFLMTGGRVQGPPDTMIADNNTLGLAMIMAWPLMHYLRETSEDRFIRLGLLGAMALSAVAIIGTYSRGALVGFSFMVLYLWWKSKRKILFAVLGICALIPAAMFLPAQWTERMQSINDYQDDASAQGRLEAWGIALKVAGDRPLTGIGFDAMVQREATVRYAPERKVPHVAHSIWFEPLADLGIPGLTIFVAIGLTGIFQAHVIRRQTKFSPEWLWAFNLATMAEIALAGYFVAGTFLSMPYYDFYYGVIALLSVLYGIVARARRERSFAFAPQRAMDNGRLGPARKPPEPSFRY
jgi:putative inorganic carbon (hco3(-)) transporter